MHYISSEDCFDHVPFSTWSRMLLGVIERGHYFFAVQDGKVTGFLGWSLADDDLANTWLTNDFELDHQNCLEGESIILNVWQSTSDQVTKFMLHHLSKIEYPQGKKTVYAKRFDENGHIRPVKLDTKRFAPSREMSIAQ